MKHSFFALLAVLLPVAILAAPDRLEQDLGQGLAYCRVHALPADLPAAAPRGALVLDLRFAQGDDNAATAFGTWLKLHATAATPVFVLVNADTAPAALAYLAAHEPGPGLVTLGPRSSRLETDIVVKTSDRADRAAYEALEHGTALATLLTDPLVKPRHDEASIAQERTGPAAEEDDSDTSDSASAAPTAPAAPAPVIDYVLLRAVHLHRTLLALRHV